MTSNQLKKLKNETLAKKLAEIKISIQNLETEYALLSNEAIERNMEEVILSDLEMKVQVKLGNSKTFFNSIEIGKELGFQKLAMISSIVEGKAKEVLSKEDLLVLEKYKSVQFSEKKIVSVSKLSKKELMG